MLQWPRYLEVELPALAEVWYAFGDFMLSTNILLSGNNYSKIALLFKYMQMGMVVDTTFYAIQDSYCVDTIKDFWQQTRAEVLAPLKAKDGVVLLGELFTLS